MALLSSVYGSSNGSALYISAQSKCSLEQGHHWKILRLAGLPIDCIYFQASIDCESAPGAAYEFFEIRPQNIVGGILHSGDREGLRKLLQLLCNNYVPNGSDDGPLEAFISTLLAGTNPRLVNWDSCRQEPAAIPVDEPVIQYFTTLWREKLSSMPQQSSARLSLLPDSIIPGLFQSLMLFVCNHIALFSTKSGNIGHCPIGATKGDHIVSLSGGNVLYIIRKVTRDLQAESDIMIDPEGDVAWRYHFIG